MNPLAIAALISAGTSIAGTAYNIFGKKGYEPQFDREAIDELISGYRQMGTRRAGQRLARANVATAGQFASRGMGGTTMATGALGANRAMMEQSLADLEAKLAGVESDIMMRQEQMRFGGQMQRTQDINALLGGIGDISLMYLLGRYGYGGAGTTQTQGQAAPMYSMGDIEDIMAGRNPGELTMDEIADLLGGNF